MTKCSQVWVLKTKITNVKDRVSCILGILRILFGSIRSNHLRLQTLFDTIVICFRNSAKISSGAAESTVEVRFGKVQTQFDSLQLAGFQGRVPGRLNDRNKISQGLAGGSDSSHRKKMFVFSTGTTGEMGICCNYSYRCGRIACRSARKEWIKQI